MNRGPWWATVHGVEKSPTRLSDFTSHRVVRLQSDHFFKMVYFYLQAMVVARIHRRTIQKNLHDPDNHDGVITHLEPDILECKVKCALGSITTNTTSGGGGIPAELFQILKDEAMKVLHSICQQVWKTAMTTGLEKVYFLSNPKERQCQECSNYHTIALISHASKVMLKILQARLQQYVNRELSDIQV